jgi:hypothetical protein
MRTGTCTNVMLSATGCTPFADPVARYLSNAISVNHRIVAATVAQKGEFRLGPWWRPFAATERFTTGRPGFEWHARIRLARFLGVDVRDEYVSGAGVTRATVCGFPLVDDQGKRELNEAALQRYLAEAVWFPTALLPSAALTWDVIDRHNAVASLEDRKTAASVMFRVNDGGEVTDILSPARYRATSTGFVLTPWAVRCRDYFEVDGFRIPRHCEVEWLLPEGPMTYWRGEVTEVRYDVESMFRIRRPAVPWHRPARASSHLGR